MTYSREEATKARYFQWFNVKRSDTPDRSDILTKYRKLLIKYHPDREGGDKEISELIN